MSENDLTLPERAALTSGADAWSTVGIGDLPAIRLSDGPHGIRRVRSTGTLGADDSEPATCFPPATALAASWDDQLIHDVGVAIGEEAHALGVHVVLGPGLNIKRSPLGGRNFEYPSEDPLVAGRYGAAFVRGVQSTGVAATPKHFAANNQETDRLRVSAEVDERALREIYLAGFERTVAAGEPWALMTAYNKINGVYASEDPWLLTQVLRGEWGFDGLAMSDWGAIWDRVAAVAAGLDLQMPPDGTDAVIVDAAASGALDPAVLDDVEQRLRTLAERTAGVDAAATGPVDAGAGRAVAYRAAVDCAVLLRNDGTLPLTAASGTIAIVGELARSPRYQGNGSSHVQPTHLTNALDELTAQLGADRARFAAGYRLDGTAEPELADEAVSAASAADVTVAFIGLPPVAESEGFDRTTLALPVDQQVLVRRMLDTGTPLVVVLSSGGIVDISAFHTETAAIFHATLLGQEGGRAIADLLTGRAAPSAKLTETFPLRLEDSPSFPSFPGRDRVSVYGEGVYVGYRGVDARGTAVAYPFGHGLSYTTFAYSDLAAHLQPDGSVAVSVTVQNTGTRDGAEIVQLYVAPPPTTQPSRPVRELREYAKVALAPGECRTLTMTLPLRAFSLWNAQEHRWRAPAGAYRVEAAASSRDIRLSATVEHPGDGLAPILTAASTLGEWREHPIFAEIIGEVRTRRGSSEPVPPELQAMVDQSPLIKLTGWGIGITEQLIDEWVRRAAQS